MNKHTLWKDENWCVAKVKPIYLPISEVCVDEIEIWEILPVKESAMGMASKYAKQNPGKTYKVFQLMPPVFQKNTEEPILVGNWPE